MHNIRKGTLIVFSSLLLLGWAGPVSAQETVTDSLRVLPSDNAGADKCRQPFFSIRTNMLYDLAAVPNIGVEARIGGRFTVKADWMYAWWYSDAKHWYWQTYGGYFGFRQYFGRRSKESPFTGHHIGAYGLAMTYDVEWGARGYQAARWGFGGGLEYGYSMPISRSLNLDFSLGVGYQDGEYKTYDPMDGHYVWQGTYLRHWWGPTKAEVSLVWVLGRNKKEGKR